MRIGEWDISMTFFFSLSECNFPWFQYFTKLFLGSWAWLRPQWSELEWIWRFRDLDESMTRRAARKCLPWWTRWPGGCPRWMIDSPGQSSGMIYSTRPTFNCWIFQVLDAVVWRWRSVQPCRSAGCIRRRFTEVPIHRRKLPAHHHDTSMAEPWRNRRRPFFLARKSGNWELALVSSSRFRIEVALVGNRAFETHYCRSKRIRARHSWILKESGETTWRDNKMTRGRQMVTVFVFFSLAMDASREQKQSEPSRTLLTWKQNPDAGNSRVWLFTVSPSFRRFSFSTPSIVTCLSPLARPPNQQINGNKVKQ